MATWTTRFIAYVAETIDGLIEEIYEFKSNGEQLKTSIDECMDFNKINN